VQSDNYLPYQAHVYTNNHVLNSALANLCYHIAGSHRFVLRLPNIFAFILLCVGTYRHFKHLKNTGSKILLTGFFLLTFNFLDFFELCRGYGLSMGCLVIGLSGLTDYLKGQKFKHLILFSLFLQLALAANLILVVVLTILLFYLYVFQFKRQLFFTFRNIVLQTFNLAALLFWIKFSFFYKDQGVLDYGVGDNYWSVSFKTLLEFLYGTNALWLQILVLIAFSFLVLFTAYFIFRNFSLSHFFHSRVSYSLLLIVLVIAFYLQKKILGVNYPEDRTGLFFFVFFVLALVFAIDEFQMLPLAVSGLVVVPTLIHFFISFNLTDFTSYYYHTMPKALYDQLKSEFEKEQRVFTVGGHRIRELNYAFLNYRGEAMLNPMDNGEEMQMNCDYYFAMQREKPFYKDYYDEIGYDKKWERVLLKRKEKIQREVFYQSGQRNYKGEREFVEFARWNDTTFASERPIEMYIAIKFNEVPKPYNAFLTLQVQNEKHEDVWYKRIPLNWLAKDLNGKEKYLLLTSGNLPGKCTVIAYIWNIDKKYADITVSEIQLSQLNGKGVTYKVPAEFYLMDYQLTKKPLL
jgi:hypothetical protein